MATLKSLAKDTAIYGTSSIIGRFLNWGLVPLYTRVFAEQEYGVVTYMYAIVAVALVILTYGMETGFFRFINHEDERDPLRVYTTSLISLAASSVAFFAMVCLFISPISASMSLADHPDFVVIMAATVAIDAFSAIPFCYLRYQKRALRFATIKLIGIGVNIALNLVLVLLCPWLYAHGSVLTAGWYDPSYGVGYIFIANLISTVVSLLMLTPTMRIRWKFSAPLLKRMLRYSIPILVLGIAGIMNQTLDKILLPVLYCDQAMAMHAEGIYGANYKIAIVMVMFIQAFRFAYEPIIFSQNREARGEERLGLYAKAMKYFILFSYVIFLGVMFYLPVLRHFIKSTYFDGLTVVPIIMIAEIFNGIFFNLSLWYKLTDRTLWGSWLSIAGLIVTVALNVALVPSMGYMGCAWAAFFCYLTMMIASYLLGRKYYPIPYDLRSAAVGGVLMLVAYAVGCNIPIDNSWLLMAARTPLLLLYVAVIFYLYRPARNERVNHSITQ